MQVKCTWNRVKKEGAKVSAAWKSCLVCPEPPSLALGLWAAVLLGRFFVHGEEWEFHLSLSLP